MMGDMVLTWEYERSGVTMGSNLCTHWEGFRNHSNPKISMDPFLDETRIVLHKSVQVINDVCCLFFTKQDQHFLRWQCLPLLLQNVQSMMIMSCSVRNAVCEMRWGLCKTNCWLIELQTLDRRQETGAYQQFMTILTFVSKKSVNCQERQVEH